jgi:hypothetical protein
MMLDKHTGGTEKKYGGGRFYLVERTLENIDAGKIGDFIREHKYNLLLKNYTTIFGMN